MSEFAIATNNGDMGGGEVMLLNIAQALRSIGFSVSVLGPSEPGELLTEAAARGFNTVELKAKSRASYMAQLRLWRMRNRKVPLWCNGLVPAMATAGIGPRIAELHIVPEGRNAGAAKVARLGTPVLVVPSHFMAGKITGSSVLQNWCEEIPFAPRTWRGKASSQPVRIGFLGRLTLDKGPHVLAHAAQQLVERGHRIQVVVAGENRFGDSQDDEVIREAFALLAERVEFMGWVQREAFFSAVDVAVFPSVCEEPFGLVAAEAMSAGVPFAISDAGGLSEVTGEDYPWIAKANDSADLARVLEDLLFTVPSEMRERVQLSRQRWEREFSPNAGVKRLHELVSLLDSAHATGSRKRRKK